MPTTPPARRPAVAASWPLGTAVVTAAMYVAFLGWHAKKERSPGGDCTGPYEPWQVVGLALALAAVVAVGAWCRHGPASVVACTLTVTVLFSLDAATVRDPCIVGANLWPIGAALVLAGAAVGLSLVALIAVGIRHKRQGAGHLP